MTQSEPTETVWAIQAYDLTAEQVAGDTAKTARGSAIAISLKNTGGVWRNYLITCAHVVKQYSRTVERTASGPLRSTIIAHPPGQGYVPWKPGVPVPTAEHDGIYTGSVIDIFNRDPGDWSQADCQPPRDWVLIELNEASFQDQPTAPCAYCEKNGTEFSVVGYPGATKALNPGQVVIPMVSQGFRLNRHASGPGLLMLDGGELVGAGMSGGGVFDAAGNLVGVYFGQDELDLSRNAIDMRRIFTELQRNGYTGELRPSVGLKESIKSWVTEFRHGPTLVSKIGAVIVFVLGIVLSNMTSISPIWPSSGLLAMTTSIGIVSTMLALAFQPISRWSRAVKLSLVSLCLIALFVCTIFYAVERQRLVQWRTGEYVMTGIDNSPASLLEPVRLVEEQEPTTDGLFERWVTVEDIWTQAAISKSRSRLFIFWTMSFVLLGAVNVLVFKVFRDTWG